MQPHEVDHSPRTEAIQDSQSLLAPILVGYKSPIASKELVAIVATACAAVPPVTVMRKRMVGRKAVAAPHARGVSDFHVKEGDTYRLITRCLDVASDETARDAFGRWVWEVGLFAFKEGSNPAPIPESHQAVRVDVTRFRIQNKGVIAAQQLALFRHMFVESIRALDPAALVIGGQRDWQPEWWPNPAPI
jgi:hypothetical protein